MKRDDGKVTSWMIEAAAPNALLRRGWSKNSLPAGTEILVEGFQAEDGTNLANGSVITFTDGKKLFVGILRSASRRSPRGAQIRRSVSL